MVELDNLKTSLKTLARAIQASRDTPTPAQIDSMIDASCDAISDAMKLVKAIWTR